MVKDSFYGEDDVAVDWDSEDDREIDDFTGISSSTPVVLNGEAKISSGEVSSVGSSGKDVISENRSSKLVDRFVSMGFPEKMVVEAIQGQDSSITLNHPGEENSDVILEALLRNSATSSAGSSGSKVIDQFLRMGFSEKLVIRAIQENGEENTNSILETLLSYSASEKSPEGPEQQHNDSELCSSEYEGSFLDDFSDLDSSEDEVFTNCESHEGTPLPSLTSMGYNKEEASIAIERCGPGATIAELTDFICAAQMAKDADPSFPEEMPKAKKFDKRKMMSYTAYEAKRKKQMKLEKKLLSGDDELIRLPNPMIGFGLPTEPGVVTRKSLPRAAMGPPYFYYENVALAPKGVWATISRFLYDVEPEFVDSQYMCAAKRKRGYVHNLPIENRFPLLPLPPLTIHEALPMTKRWWPEWDNRTKLNCLQTCIGSAKLTERLRKALEPYDGEPPLDVQKAVMDQNKKWNLVWVGKNKVAPLEPDEVELLLGFPKNHTRGGGISRTDRYKSLGNSFQVDTVAYHLSVLKDLYPQGINVLSLFSGIGGAEVALHRLGIRLKTVVSVEISAVNRGIMRCWWDQTNQTGNLIDIPDVQQLDDGRLEHLMSIYGAFDLVIGGSPCNNLAGSNRHHRDGLEGKESSLFFDYCRILDSVRTMTARNR